MAEDDEDDDESGDNRRLFLGPPCPGDASELGRLGLIVASELELTRGCVK